MKTTDKQIKIKKTLGMLKRRTKRGVNSLEAISLIDSPRVAARIYDLKKLGYRISSVREEWKGRPSVRYTLIGGYNE